MRDEGRKKYNSPNFSARQPLLTFDYRVVKQLSRLTTTDPSYTPDPDREALFSSNTRTANARHRRRSVGGSGLSSGFAHRPPARCFRIRPRACRANIELTLRRRPPCTRACLHIYIHQYTRFSPTSLRRALANHGEPI